MKMNVSSCLNINDGKRCSLMIGPFTKDRCFPTFQNDEIRFVQCLDVEIGDIPAKQVDGEVIISMPEGCPYMKERLF